MRRLVILALALLAVHVALLMVRPSHAEVPIVGEGLDVGVVFDVGGRGDKSFNDGAFVGAERAIRELGARIRYIEPGEGTDREAGLRLLAAENMDLVIGVGFIFSDDLAQLSQEYPNVRFAGIDYAPPVDSAGNMIPPTKPSRFELPTSAASAPTRKEPSSSRNLSAARFAGGGIMLPAESTGGA